MLREARFARALLDVFAFVSRYRPVILVIPQRPVKVRRLPDLPRIVQGILERLLDRHRVKFVVCP